MKHDLSECKVGDYICTPRGWEKIVKRTDGHDYPIETRFYTIAIGGFHYLDDKVPIAYTEPPEEWFPIVGPKPCGVKNRKKNALIRDVLVWYQSKSAEYRWGSLLEDCVKDYNTYTEK